MVTSPLPSTRNQPQRVWAIGGGKGGVGKTFVSTSLAVSLSKLGRAVTLVDLDMGGANAHTYFGLPSPKMTLSDFLAGRANSLEELAVNTNVPNVRLISGSSDALGAANLSRPYALQILGGVAEIRTPYVILDLGAGTADYTLDFFLSADRRIVTITPEPTSIENAYRFIKAAFFSHLRDLETDPQIKRLIRSAMGHKNELGIRAPSDLLRHIQSIDPAIGEKILGRTKDFAIDLILNQIRTRGDIELGHSVRSVCHKYFGIEANFVGHVSHDNAVWQALRARRLLAIDNPYSEVLGQFLAITRQLVAKDGPSTAAPKAA